MPPRPVRKHKPLKRPNGLGSIYQVKGKEVWAVQFFETHPVSGKKTRKTRKFRSSTLALQFHPEIDPEVLEEWLAMEGGCAEVEAEGVDPDELRAQTKALQSITDQNAFDLVNTFLDRIATAEVIPVN